MESPSILFMKEVSLDEKLFKACIYDCEAAGLLILVKNSHGDKHTLTIMRSEMELVGLSCDQSGYETIIRSLKLEEEGGNDRRLISTISGFRKPQATCTPIAAENYLKTAKAGHKTLPELLTKGLTELCREKPIGLDAVQWLGEWLRNHNPNQPIVEMNQTC